MSRRTLLGLLLLLSVPRGSMSKAHVSDMMVAAYLPEWRYEGANWVDICATVTHLILFSLEVTTDGRLDAFDRIPRKELLLEARAAGPMIYGMQESHGGFPDHQTLICSTCFTS